jgi:hypothetical protein
MEDAHRYIAGLKHLGKFMAYEIVCDLIHTHVLRDTLDKNTWCNPGPGCVRGTLRLKNVDFSNFQRNAINVGGNVILEDCRYLLGRLKEDIPRVIDGELLIYPPTGVGYARGTPYQEYRQDILADVGRRFGKTLTPYDGRFVEGCLCEFDKYQRLLRQDGRSKRRYVPGKVVKDTWERNLSFTCGG